MSGSLMMLLLEKMRRGILQEEEAHFLLQAFGEKVPRTVSQRMEAIDERIVEEGSFKYAALYYKKDPRTIRRWRAKHFFPSATPTRGGQWRIPFDRIQEAESKAREARCRKPKTVFGTSEWHAFSALMKRVFAGIFTVREIEGRLRDLSSSEFHSQNCPISDQSLELFKSAVAEGKVALVRLRAAVRRIRACHPAKTITVGDLARELRLSRATLYRPPYGPKRIRAAIREVDHE